MAGLGKERQGEVGSRWTRRVPGVRVSSSTVAGVVVTTLVATMGGLALSQLSAAGFSETAAASSATQTRPSRLATFSQPLAIPPKVDLTGGGSATLTMRGGTHRFSPALPPTPTLGYAVGSAPGKDTFGGPTLVARRGVPVSVTVKNELGAHPLAGSMDHSLMGMAPDDATMPRGTLHLHGAHDPADMDGLPASTFTPGESFTYHYGNDQEATGLWYHDHAWGMTRLQVTAGLAGQYWLRDQYDTGTASNPLGLPSGADEVPLTLQDRTFNADGTFAYPVGAFAGAKVPAGYPDTWAPESFGDTSIVNGTAFPNLDVHRGLYRFRVLNASNARFYNLSFDKPGVTFYQIGSDGGLLDRPAPLTSLRLAPAERADLLVDFSRFEPGTKLRFTNDAVGPYPSGAPTAAEGGNPLPEVMQFTVTGAKGFQAPVPTRLRGRDNQPAGIVDLHASKTRTIMLNEIEDPAQPVHVMTNNQFYADGMGMPRTTQIETPTANTVEEWDIVNTTEDAHPIHLHLTQFQVKNRQDFDKVAYTAAVNLRLALKGVAGAGLPEPSAAGQGPWPAVRPAPFLLGAPTAPPANESGWKDTIVAMPGQVTRILVPFGGTAAGIPAPFTGDARGAAVQHFLGSYVLHCHILEHEDNDMMQPFRVVAP